MDYLGSVPGGDGGIRTLDTSFSSYAPLAGECLRPLGHISGLPETTAVEFISIADDFIRVNNSLSRERIRAFGSVLLFNQFNFVAVRIFQKGNYDICAFQWTWLAGDFHTCCAELVT